MKDRWIVGAYLIALISLAGAIIAGSIAVENSERLDGLQYQVEENKGRIYEHTVDTPNVTLTDYQIRFTESSSFRTCVELKISGENRFKFSPGHIWTMKNGSWMKEIVARYRVVPESETSSNFYKMQWFCHQNQNPVPGEYPETKVTFYHDEYPVEFNYTVTDKGIHNTLPDFPTQDLEVRIPVE